MCDCLGIGSPRVAHDATVTAIFTYGLGSAVHDPCVRETCVTSRISRATAACLRRKLTAVRSPYRVYAPRYSVASGPRRNQPFKQNRYRANPNLSGPARLGSGVVTVLVRDVTDNVNEARRDVHCGAHQHCSPTPTLQ
eukprot:1937085-Prymnesium_polylepis.1